MFPRSQSSRSREGIVGEPPPFYKYFRWVLDNWKNHKTISAVFVILVLFGAVSVFVETVFRIRNLATQSPSSAKGPIPSPSSSPSTESLNQAGTLSDDDAMPAIERALLEDDIRESIRLLSLMKQGSMKANECEHVYGYGMKHEKWEQARDIVDLCWVGDEKRRRIDEILHASLKK